LGRRSGAAYPPKGDPVRNAVDEAGAGVARTVKAMAVVDRSDLRGAVNAAGPILGKFLTRHNRDEIPVADAVDALRFAAMRRPQLVRDARTIVHGWDAR
jgi:hypothetical protein